MNAIFDSPIDSLMPNIVKKPVFLLKISVKTLLESCLSFEQSDIDVWAVSLLLFHTRV